MEGYRKRPATLCFFTSSRTAGRVIPAWAVYPKLGIGNGSWTAPECLSGWFPTVRCSLPGPGGLLAPWCGRDRRRGSDSRCSKRYPIQIFSSVFAFLPQKHHEPLFFTMIRRGPTTCSMKSWFNRKFSATSSSPFGSLQNFHMVCWSVSRKCLFLYIKEIISPIRILILRKWICTTPYS